MNIKQVNMHEAKSRLSELGELVWEGKKVVITKDGKPYLDLVPHRERRAQRIPGRFRGQIQLGEDFNQTPAEVLYAGI